MREKRQRHAIAIVLLLVLGMAGCLGALIPEPTKNPVPAGLALKDVRRLIVLSIDKSAKTQWDNPTTTSQKVLREVFASLQASNKWGIESIEPNAIRAATHPRSHYVAVKVHFTEVEWWVVIVDGRRIKFDGERIHKKAIFWVDSLEQHIRRAFGSYQTKDRIRAD